MPNCDSDMARIKLITELEVPHRLELEAKEMEI